MMCRCADIYKFAAVVVAVLSSMVTTAQTPMSVYDDLSQPSIMDVSMEVLRYVESLDDMISQVAQADSVGVEKLRGEQWKLDFRWGQYYPQVESVIASDDDLMDGVLAYNTRSQSLIDSLDRRSKQLEAQKSIDSELAKLQQSVVNYDQMSNKALSYSLSKRAEKKLTALKAQETIAFEQVQSSYAVIDAACTELGDQQQRAIAEALYSQILISSESIKSAAYKSLYERGKEYLYGLAAVVMILMFVNMVHTKISSAKKLRESAKVMEKLTKGGDKQYPTI